MAQTPPTDDVPLERFRGYLHLLARLHLAGGGAVKLDASDVVQQALLEAHRQRGHFRGGCEAEMAAWLRQILAGVLADRQRAQLRAKRDVTRERSLEAALDRSSVLIGSWLAAPQSSPSAQAQRHEEAVRLAAALATLPDAQREALVLRYYQNQSIDDISGRLGRSPAAVAGLLKRGVRQLRTLLAQDRSES
jgi:RNA polymerase sigma-70 factor (ECF subfamily)